MTYDCGHEILRSGAHAAQLFRFARKRQMREKFRI
jgi:hypothetical protein